MNIATALNKKYIPYTVVMLLSLCENNTDHIDAYLYNSELDGPDIKEIREALSEYDITVIPVNIDRKRFDDRLPRNRQWSIEMYYRLLMTETLPADVDRILYLDVDIIINKSLYSLYNLPFEENLLYVADDKGGKNDPSSYGIKHQEMFREAYQKGYRYFNSGVMLLDIERLRNKYSFSTYLNAIEEWNYEMEAPDQDILNWVHWKEVKYVDYKVYDYFARVAHNDHVTYQEAKDKVAILHFAGEKPWDYRNFHYDLEMLWWDYAKKTPYYKKFLEHFVEDAFSNSIVEDYITEISGINKELTSCLNDIINKMKTRMEKLN